MTWITRSAACTGWPRLAGRSWRTHPWSSACSRPTGGRCGRATSRPWRRLPAWRGRGLATRLMEAADEHIRAGFELGALSTDVHGLYERLGWERWRGPTFVRTADGPVRTEDEDGGIMILRTPRTPPLTLREALSCEWRAGDAW